MTFRLAIGGIHHETNTWAVELTGPTTLERFTVRSGDALIAGARASRGGYIGGMVAAADELGAEVVGAIHAEARPSGTIAAETYARLKSDLLNALATLMPLDAIGLGLHGAGVVEGLDDLEGDVALATREALGPRPKLVCPLDLHANVTDRMAEHLDAMFGVHLYPHTDAFDRGHEAVSLVPRLLSGEIRPVTRVVHLPMLLPPATTDPGNPAATMNALCRRMEERDGVVDCTVFHGFPYTDIPDVGVHVVATTNGDAGLALDCAEEVGRWIWGHRDEFLPEAYAPEEAIERALAVDGGPVVINDTSDNPGGGTPGDGTHLLRALVESGVRDAAFATIFDPAAVAAAFEAGPGTSIDVELGGHHGTLHGTPVAVRAQVRAVTDGRFVIRAFGGTGAPMDLGRMARLAVGGLDVLVASRPHQIYDPEVFLLHGIDVQRCKVVALKSSNHFRAGFRDLAKAIITADSPGLTTLRVDRFERLRAPGPMWPSDTGASWSARRR